MSISRKLHILQCMFLLHDIDLPPIEVHHLPSELVKMILACLSGTLATNWIPSESSVHAIALVCRRFREIVLCTPELWTEVAITLPNKKFPHWRVPKGYELHEDLEKHFERLLKNLPGWIQKSNRLPLRIIITNHVRDMMLPNRADFNRMWEILLLAAPRWKSLQFQGDHGTCSTFVQRCTEAVALESLGLILTENSRHVTIPSLQLPKLKHLTLGGVGCGDKRLPSLSCPLLETIDFKFYIISLLAICNLASGCPHLTDLTMRSCNLNDIIQPGDIPDFPNLRSCHLQGSHTYIVDMFAAAPVLTTLTLEFHSLIPQSSAQTLNITHLNLEMERAVPLRPVLGDTLASFPQLTHLSIWPMLRKSRDWCVKALIEKLTFHTVNRDFELQDLTLTCVEVPRTTLLQFSAAAKMCKISANQCLRLPDFELMRFEELLDLLDQGGASGFMDVEQVAWYDNVGSSGFSLARVR